MFRQGTFEGVSSQKVGVICLALGNQYSDYLALKDNIFSADIVYHHGHHHHNQIGVFRT